MCCSDVLVLLKKMGCAMLIDDIRLGESAELEFKRVPNDAPERWLRTVVALAAAFAYMFFIENWGSGLLRVQRALKEAGLAPLEVQDFGTAIRLTVKRRMVVAERDNRGDNRGDNPFAALPDEQRRICSLLRENPKISIRKMAELLGIRKNTLDRQLSALKAKGFVERVGGTRGSWRIVLSRRA